MKLLAPLALLCLLLPAWAQAESYALLVGVGRYPGLAAEWQLEGPANDVRLMREVLLQKGFQPRHIRLLTDGPPGAVSPTRRHILEAFQSLTRQLRPGDYVYVHFSGHGSQAPSTADKQPPEPDGLDEIFLPRDVGQWSGKIGSVRNALLDRELNRLMGDMRRRGAFVWAVFDTCHAGSLSRGVTASRFRQVSTQALGIPRKILDELARRFPQAAKAGALGREDSAQGGFVAFYASQSTERAPEYRLPQAARSQGVFSYLLAEALTRFEGISYRQLGQHIQTRYPALGFDSEPTPLFEGSGLDAPIFGKAALPPVRQWRIRPEAQGRGGRLRIQAGSLQQFSRGALFALVADPAASDRDIVGYARAEQVTPLQATLVPVVHGGKPRLSRLPKTTHARLVDPALHLGVTVALPASPGAGMAEKAALDMLAELRAKPPEGIEIAWRPAGLEADIHLHLEDGKLWFLSAHGVWERRGAGRGHSVALDGPQAREAIAANLQAMARSLNLLRLASQLGAGGRELETRLLRHRADGGPPEVLDGAGLPQLKAGDQLELLVANRSGKPVDLTVLFLDGGYGIKSLYPREGELNRIEAGGELPLRLTVDAGTRGLERLLLLAVPAEPQTPAVSLAFLEQPTLPRERGAQDDLSALFAQAGFGTSRSLPSAPPRTANIRLYSWSIQGE